MIQLAAHMYTTPREMLVHVNRRLYDGIERKSFITMILALFDLEAGEVRLCRAGHNKAIVAAGDGLRLLDSGGIGLGLERGPIFERSLQELSYPLVPGNVFFLYSDGLSEAMDTQDRQFGEEEIGALIEKHKGDSAQAIQDAVLGAVRAFQGEADQHDDMTVVVAKVC
jgi:serine phosphatase RsbU (regulator of sigma subunit)